MLVLVVDDDSDVRDSLALSLEFEGYAVATAPDGAEALRRAAADKPDLMIVDVMMPGVDGLEACRRLRAAGNRVPILMLTARDALGDRVTGLDAGADDYLVKPFALEELLARVRALLRPARRQERPQPPSEQLRFEDLTLDPGTREVFRGDRPISLTPTEFDLLKLLISAPRQVLTRTHLQREVWGHEPNTNNLDVYVGYLRRKTEAGGEPRLLHTVRGVGYVLRSP
ncbi:response regulator transcription factor [Amycolatopsis taiwanensis]|uniref:DNA-binding response regulator n=1 Tax=Amycolatopsis taiwanensis TaxID=342230 RepID=A0A9W6QYL0_9PSEU|nr:response regulator transcription factor [Amycolatopsis taiwanensis]GLY65191.1 DNA-binding response regulator [Amycolatopsis taiwanensis]